MATPAELRGVSIVLRNHAADLRISAEAARDRSAALREQGKLARELADTARALAMSRTGGTHRSERLAHGLGAGR